MTKALFWDFDGTIIHPNESFLYALDTAFKNQNYHIPLDKVRSFLHSACSWYTPDITYTDQTGKLWWDNLFLRFAPFYNDCSISATDRKRINAAFKEQILDVRSYTLYDDAKTVLAQCLEQGYRNYILSNNYPELPFIISNFGLSPFFTDYIISSNIGYEKPRTELFQHALCLADFPDTCFMIGDNPTADIQGGKSAGMKTILVHRTGNFDADYFCENLSEIPSILHTLCSVNPVQYPAV